MRSEFSSNQSETARPVNYCPQLEVMIQWRNSYLTREVFYSSVACCVVNSLLALVTATSNTLVIASILKNRWLRRSKFMLLLVSLSITDLLIGLLVQPLMVICRICEILERPDLVCPVRTSYMVLGIICAGASLGHISLISIERYLSVRYAARYKYLLTFKKTLSAIAFIWIFFILYAILPVTVYPKLGAKVGRSFIIAVIVIITASCYTGVFFKIGSSRQAVNTTVSTTTQQRIKKEKKLAKFMLLTVGLLALFYFPEMIAYPIMTNNPNNVKLIWIGLSWTQTQLYTNSLVNPFLYCWRFKQVRRGVLKLIGCTNIIDYSSESMQKNITMTVSRFPSRPASAADRCPEKEQRVAAFLHTIGTNNNQNADRFLAVPQI